RALAADAFWSGTPDRCHHSRSRRAPEMTYNWPDGRPLVGPFNVPTLPDDAYRVEPMQVNTDPRLPGYTEAPTLPVGDTVEARSAGVASFDSAGSISAPSSRPNPGSPASAPERLENTMTDLPTQVGGG